MKNFIKPEHSCPDEQYEVCTGKNRCGQVKKVRNSLIVLGFAMVAVAYLALFPEANQLRSLQAQVKPYASLYANPKNLVGVLTLVDDKKQTLSLSETINKHWALLFFGYTHCLDDCPAGLTKLDQVIKQSKNAKKIQTVFISIDPQRDIGKLSKFVQRFNPGFLSLAIDTKDLEKVSKEMGIHHEIMRTKSKLKNDYKQHADMSRHSNNNLVEHSANFFLVSPDFELTAAFSTAYNSGQIAKALDLIIQTLN